VKCKVHASTTPTLVVRFRNRQRERVQSSAATGVADAGIAPSVDHDPVLSMIFATLKISGGLKPANAGDAPGGHPHLDLQLQMSVGGDGLVR
jgi:hypothetical protein